MERERPVDRSVLAVAKRVWREAVTDRTMLSASGLAFFAMFALLPAIAAAGVLYGALVGEEAIERQLSAIGDALPEGTEEVLREFLTSVPAGLGLGTGLALNMIIILWTVQRSSSGIITALNITHDVEEQRGRVRRECVALGVASASLLFLFAALFLIAALPLFAPAMAQGAADMLMIGRWPLLALLFFLYLGGIYRFAPAEAPRRFRWISIGALVALALWLAASGLFSLYIAHLGGFSRFYGSITGAMVLMFWLFITSLVILVGAEVNEQLIETHDGHPREHMKEHLDRA